MSHQFKKCLARPLSYQSIEGCEDGAAARPKLAHIVPQSQQQESQEECVGDQNHHVPDADSGMRNTVSLQTVSLLTDCWGLTSTETTYGVLH